MEIYLVPYATGSVQNKKKQKKVLLISCHTLVNEGLALGLTVQIVAFDLVECASVSYRNTQRLEATLINHNIYSVCSVVEVPSKRSACILQLWLGNECFHILRVPGPSILHFFCHLGHYSERMARDFIGNLLSALVYMHAANIAHLDIKAWKSMRWQFYPSNDYVFAARELADRSQCGTHSTDSGGFGFCTDMQWRRCQSDMGRRFSRICITRTSILSSNKHSQWYMASQRKHQVLTLVDGLCIAGLLVCCCTHCSLVWLHFWTKALRHRAHIYSAATMHFRMDTLTTVAKKV